MSVPVVAGRGPSPVQVRAGGDGGDGGEVVAGTAMGTVGGGGGDEQWRGTGGWDGVDWR